MGRRASARSDSLHLTQPKSHELGFNLLSTTGLLVAMLIAVQLGGMWRTAWRMAGSWPEVLDPLEVDLDSEGRVEQIHERVYFD